VARQVTSRDADDTLQISIVRRILRKPVAGICLVYLVGVIGACCAASVLAPDNPLAQNLSAVEQGPSWTHLLGTDELGRDVLSRLLYGGRPTLLGAAEAVVVAIVLGVVLGISSGYLGGWFDRIIGRALVDVGLSVPMIIILLTVLIVFDESMTAGMIAFGVLASMGVLRVVRSATLAAREELYVSAARVSGLSGARIVIRHIFPAVTGPIIVQATILGSTALVVQGGLSYLGLGAPPPAPTWGGMIEEAQQLIIGDSWLLVPAGLALGLSVVALGLLGDAIRDASQERWSVRGQPAVTRHLTRAPGPAVADPVPAPAPADGLLVVRNLTISMAAPDGDLPIVRDLSFQIAAGEVLGVIGESGCGKTLTVLSLLGLLPKGIYVSAGDAFLAGQPLSLAPPARGHLSNGIGMIFQEPVPSLDPVYTVGSQLSEVVRIKLRVSRSEARRQAVDLLRLVHLDEPEQVASSYPYQLSGGMAQRVSIARALAGDPILLMADEPTTALDVSVQAEILDLLSSLTDERGMGMLLVTHDWGVLADMCERALVLYAGELVEAGTVASLWAHPRHPYTARLIKANPYFATPGAALTTISGVVPEPGNRPAGCAFADRCELASDDCRSHSIPLIASHTEGGFHRCLHSERIAPISK
jgi:peptide/nickel transport system permease protein